MEFDEDELAAEIAVQEANVWRRRRIHLPANFEELIAEDEDYLDALVESGFEGTIRLPWGIRLRISVRWEAIRRARGVLRRCRADAQRRRREQARLNREGERELLRRFPLSWGEIAARRDERYRGRMRIYTPWPESTWGETTGWGETTATGGTEATGDTAFQSYGDDWEVSNGAAGGSGYARVVIRDW